MYSPEVIVPRTANTAPNTTTSITWMPESTSETDQKRAMTLASLTHRPVYSAFCASKRSRSYRSRPKARTTRTPVRFS